MHEVVEHMTALWLLITALVFFLLGLALGRLRRRPTRSSAGLPGCSNCRYECNWSDMLRNPPCVRCITQGKYQGYKPRRPDGRQPGELCRRVPGKRRRKKQDDCQ